MTAQPMILGILQTGHAPDALMAEHGDYDAMFVKLLSRHGFRFETYPVVDMVFPGAITAADAWLITGSRHGAYDDLPWIPPLEQFIRDAYGAGVPLVGICFGHQIIAQALGGRVEKFTGGWAVGPTTYRFADGAETKLNAWHQDQVVEKPAAAEVIATHDFCANAALVYGDRAWTIQPHPEFGPDFLYDLIETRGRGLVPDDQLDAAEARLAEPLQRSEIADRIAAFLRQPRG